MREIVKGLETLNVFVIGFLLFYLVATRLRLPNPKKWNYRRIAGYSTAVFFIYYIVISLVYVFSPSFIDHIEASVAMKSLLAGVGGEVYTGLGSVNRISILYGPSCYIFSMLLQKIIANPIYASKLAGVFLALGSIVALTLALRKSSTKQVYLYGICYCIMILLVFRHFSFWNRPDSAIIFGCSLACAGIMIHRKAVSVLLIAFGTAIAVNAKVHAFAYLIPLLPIFIKQSSFRIITLTFILSGMLTLLPFWLFESFSLTNYIDWLFLAGKHPSRLLLFLQSISQFLVLSVPVIAAAIIIRSNKSGDDKSDYIWWSTVLLIFFGFMISIISAKAQAGYYHILGFAPIITTLLVKQLTVLKKDEQTYTDTAARNKRLLFSLGLSLAVVLTIGVFKGQKKVIGYLAADQSRNVRNDLQQIKQKYEDKSIMMGYGGRKGYEYTFLRPLLFDPSANEFIDAPALMDMLAAEIKMPDKTISKMASKPFDIILIPKGGEPFSLESFYLPHEDLFPPQFVTFFKAYYHLVDSTDYYMVWRH